MPGGLLLFASSSWLLSAAKACQVGRAVPTGSHPGDFSKAFVPGRARAGISGRKLGRRAQPQKYQQLLKVCFPRHVLDNTWHVSSLQFSFGSSTALVPVAERCSSYCPSSGAGHESGSWTGVSRPCTSWRLKPTTRVIMSPATVSSS